MRHRRSALLWRFCGDERGFAIMELVVWLPLLIALVVLFAEFGRALLAHHIVVNGVRDGLRFLARAPLTDPFIDQAKNVALTGRPANGTPYPFWSDPNTITVSQTQIDDGTTFRTPTTVRIEMSAAVPLDLPLLGILNSLPGFGDYATTITIGVTDRARHIGD